MYVFVHVCVPACVCVYMIVCVCVYVCTYIYICMCVCMYVCSMYVCCVHEYMCVCVCVCMYVCVYICMCVCMYVCVECMSACVYMYVYVWLCVCGYQFIIILSGFIHHGHSGNLLDRFLKRGREGEMWPFAGGLKIVCNNEMFVRISILDSRLFTWLTALERFHFLVHNNYY